MIQSNFALKNRHKSKMGYLILDSKTWDFQIQIILIQIKLFEQLAPEDQYISPFRSRNSTGIWASMSAGGSLEQQQHNTKYIYI